MKRIQGTNHIGAHLSALLPLSRCRGGGGAGGETAFTGERGGGRTQPPWQAAPPLPSVSVSALPWLLSDNHQTHPQPVLQPFPTPSPAGICVLSASFGAAPATPGLPYLGSPLHLRLERKAARSQCLPSKPRATAALHRGGEGGWPLPSAPGRGTRRAGWPWARLPIPPLLPWPPHPHPQGWTQSSVAPEALCSGPRSPRSTCLPLHRSGSNEETRTWGVTLPTAASRPPSLGSAKGTHRQQT